MEDRGYFTQHSALTTEEIDRLLDGVEVDLPVLPEIEEAEKPAENDSRGARRAFFREQIASLGNIELEVRIELGQTTMLLSEVAKLRPGSVVILDKHVDELVNILVNGKAIARGKLLVVDGCFGVQIAEFL